MHERLIVHNEDNGIMLRQVYLIKEEVIYSYIFAEAFDSETLKLVLEQKLVSFIKSPLEGKVFSKPLFNYQSHYGSFKGVFFLFVTDMADRPKVIAKEIDRSAKLFHKNFKTPSDIKAASAEKEEFTNYIQETHYFLHPKIALAGPAGAGKTSIINMLKINDAPDKKIMNFAEFYRVKIGELFFDLWDFVQPDDQSPLWNNYIRGSDIIFLLLNAADMNAQKAQFFVNLKRREGKYSNMVVVFTHIDEAGYPAIDELKEQYPAIATFKTYEINLAGGDNKAAIVNIFNDAIGLKKPLPDDFRTRLVEANGMVGKENYIKAIPILKELTAMAKEYQELKYFDVLSKKVIELEERLAAQKAREEQEKAKITAPKKVDFKSFKGVGSLPGKGLPTAAGLPKIGALPEKPMPQAIPVPEPKAHPTPPMETVDTTITGIGSDIAEGIKAGNPFFSGLKPVPKRPEPVQEPLVAPTEPQRDAIEFKTHKEFKKVDPIDIRSIGASGTGNFAERVLEKSLSIMKEGVGVDKKLSFKRSNLISDAPAPSDIQKTQPITKDAPEHHLNGITRQEPAPIYSAAAEQLGTEIRNLGESLSRKLCEKFVEQLKIKMKKTNLTDADLKNAAAMYVRQRRKK